MGLFDRLFAHQSHDVSEQRPIDVSGTWEGYYRQHDEECGIRAVFEQDGEQLTGQMVDLSTESEHSLYEAACEAGLPPGADERLDEAIRRLLPGAGQEPIRIRVTLPEKSLLRGTIRGRQLRFIKSYQGQHFLSYEVGEQSVRQLIEDHSVQYWGRVADDQQSIEGLWTISSPGSPGGNAQGPFLLRRS